MNALESFLAAFNYIRPVIDIGVLTFLLYKAYRLIIRTNGIQIIRAAVVVAFFFAFAFILHLETLMWLLTKIAPGLAIAFAIVFQPELRKLFLKIGQNQWFTFGDRSKHSLVDAVISAAEELSKLKKGMLVVFTRQTKLGDIIGTGTKLNADVSTALLVTIFKFETPLHDAACIVEGGKIIAAGCFLPLSEQYDIKKTFGTRHRSALGLAETTDAVVLVVSEETGAISLAYDSKLHYDLKSSQVKKILEKLLDITPEKQTLGDSFEGSFEGADGGSINESKANI